MVSFYFVLILGPLVAIYIGVRQLVTGDLGHPLAILSVGAISIFYIWLNSRARVKRAISAYYYLVNTCIKNDQPWLFRD